MRYSDKALPILRIGFGLYWLTQGLGKTPAWFQSGQALAQNVQQGAQRAEPFYGAFLTGTVLPNVNTIAALTALGELTVGISFLLGVGVRLGAPVAIWLNLNYMLMKGLASSGGSVDRLFVLASLVFAVTAAGLVWGLDGVLARRFTSVPVLGWLVGAESEPDGDRAPARPVAGRQPATP